MNPNPKFCSDCGGPVFWDLVTNHVDHSREEWRQAGRDEWDGAHARAEAAEEGEQESLERESALIIERDALRSQLAEARRLAESRLGTFREMVADRDTWADRAKSAGWPGVGVRWDADAVLRDLRRELAEARETNVRLNRRCQAYEAGLQEKSNGGGRGFGRMLANAAATMEKERADAAEKALVEARRESAEWIDALRADVRHALEERDEAREEIERLTMEKGALRSIADGRYVTGKEFHADLCALRAFLDEVKPVLLWVCKTPGFGKWEDLARTLIGKWPK